MTYGGMSLQPVSIPTSLLIFKDVACRGFWLSNPAKEGSRLATIERIVGMYQAGRLQPCRCIGLLSFVCITTVNQNRTRHLRLEDFQEALEAYYGGFGGSKLVFTPNPDLIH